MNDHETLGGHLQLKGPRCVCDGAGTNPISTVPRSVLKVLCMSSFVAYGLQGLLWPPIKETRAKYNASH